MSNMNAVIIERYGGIEELRMRDVPVPEIKEDQVLIEMHATSINPYDWKIRSGSLKDMVPLRFPIILGWDAAGVIVQKGGKVERFDVGDRVFARPRTSNRGCYAQYVATEEKMLAAMPKNLGFEKSASIPLVALTAWQCLVDLGKLQAGERVLIHAGGGGVGRMAIQIAKLIGAHVATTGSGKNRQAMMDLGADLFIDYGQQDFDALLNEYDLVLDAVGGDIQDRSYRVLKKGGKLISIVNLPDPKRASEFGVNACFHLLKPNGDQLGDLAKLLEEGTLKPFVGQVFPFSESGIQEAHALSETHHAEGKIVIRIRQ
jgi:NADPH:quinone reductase-like Zn-dependent oxidoreductase